MKQTIRTFVAVEISAAIRDRAEELIAHLRPATADIRWVEPGNLHLTLKFLGSVAAQEISRVCTAVARGAAQCDPFELEVRGAGAFPNVRRPRTVWLGAGRGQAEMITLHDRVEAALSELGYRKEPRRFQPHLTLGRVRRGGPAVGRLGELVAEHADFEAGEAWVREVVVFSSRLTPTGPIYEALSRASLGRITKTA